MTDSRGRGKKTSRASTIDTKSPAGVGVAAGKLFPQLHRAKRSAEGGELALIPHPGVCFLGGGTGKGGVGKGVIANGALVKGDDQDGQQEAGPLQGQDQR